MTRSNSLSDKNIFVTGASGYIGAALVEELVKKSSNVVRVSRNDLIPIDGTKTIKSDIRNFDAWNEIVGRADVIFHLAGNTSVYEAAANPAESLNSTVLPVNHLIRAAQEQKRKPRVVYASTATVYGLTYQFPVNETAIPKPITVYDMHKLFAEQQLALAKQQGVLDSVSLRLSNVYGPSGSLSSALDRGILNKITTLAMRGGEIIIYGDGNYLRDYVYIDDVIRAFMVAGHEKETMSGVFNVSTGRSISVDHAFRIVANKVAIFAGMKVNVKYAKWPNGASEIEYRNYISDTRLVLDNLGWQYQVNLEDGIELMMHSIGRSQIND